MLNHVVRLPSERDGAETLSFPSLASANLDERANRDDEPTQGRPSGFHRSVLDYSDNDNDVDENDDDDDVNHDSLVWLKIDAHK